MGLISLQSIYKFTKRRFIIQKPFILSHCITYKCNLKCKFCLFTKNIANKNELTLKEIYKMLDNAKNAGFFLYHITGREPLMRKDLSMILEYAKANGFLTYLNTNGTLLKERLKEIAPSLDMLSISIDGTEKTHNEIRGSKDAYKKTLAGIVETKKLGIKLKIISTIGLDNIDEMEEIAKVSMELRVPLVFQVRNVNEKVEFHENEFKEFIRKIYLLKNKGYLINNSNRGIFNLQNHHYICNYPKMFINVSSSGDIYSCLEPFFGNIKEVSLKCLLFSESFKEFIKKTKKCKETCRILCVTETNPVYNLNLLKIITLLKRGIA